jgi:hypothetical protein
MKKNSSKKAEQETCFFLTFFSIDIGGSASGGEKRSQAEPRHGFDTWDKARVFFLSLTIILCRMNWSSCF